MFFVLGLLILAAPAAGSGASKQVLLEQAIYTEETAGDVEAAIRLYRQIVAGADAERAVVAQALYRLGLCLERRGRKDESREAFDRLVRDFAEQTELTALVRARLVPKLLPVPWTDGERLRYMPRMADNERTAFAEDVWIFSKGTGAPTWVLRRYRVYPFSPRSLGSSSGSTELHLEAETSAPLLSLQRGTGGGLEIRYASGRAHVVNKGVNAAVDLKGTVFDRVSLPLLLRRLPLAEGYQTSVPIFSHTAGVTDARVKVVARESVTVPAGTFDCFKTTVSVGPVHSEEESYWISTDAQRLVVKFGRGLFYELRGTDKYDGRAAPRFEDAAWGVTLEPPTGWLFVRSQPRADETFLNVGLLSPDAEVSCSVGVEHDSAYRWARERSPREVAEADIGRRNPGRSSHVVRPDSWSDAVVAGLPAVRYVADYREMFSEVEMVEYAAYVRSQARVVEFSCRAARAVFEARRADMEALVQSVRVP